MNVLDRDWLEHRIRRAVCYVPADKRTALKWGRFSYNAKRITSACGRLVLQWEPRGREGFVTFIEV